MNERRSLVRELHPNAEACSVADPSFPPSGLQQGAWLALVHTAQYRAC